VTAEALAHGLPAVGFADCPGTNELIVHGSNGILVAGGERVRALGTALRLLMNSPTLRVELGRNGPGSVLRFSLDAITDRWEALLTLVAAGRPPAQGLVDAR
jgi:glycosyltransferase involved in cell wall biosynthesis